MLALLGSAFDGPAAMTLQQALLFVLPVMLGVALVAVARWARRRNRELNQDPHFENDFVAHLKRRNRRAALEAYLHGSLPVTTARLGQWLIIGVIVFVSCVVVALVALLFLRSGL